MNDKSLEKITIDLRRKLFNVLTEFWINDECKKFSTKEIFYINSIVFSSLLAQISSTMFKTTNITKIEEYIDEMCTMAKEQLRMGIQ